MFRALEERQGLEGLAGLGGASRFSLQGAAFGFFKGPL